MTASFVVVTGLLFVSIESAVALRSCGRRVSENDNLIGRVVGGHKASFGEVPWQASIQESRLFGLFSYRKCGAVVIHRHWLLTAAHCTTMWPFSELIITMGEHEIAEDSSNKKKKKKQPNDSDLLFKRDKNLVQKRKVKRIVAHPMFSPLDLEDDIALIELDRPLDFGPNIQPICLPRKNADFTRKQGTVSGWGFTAYRKSLGYYSLLAVTKLQMHAAV